MKRLRYAVDRLRDALGLRGNDGLTRKERAAIAAEYRRKVMRPLTPQEAEAMALWRERRL